MKFQRFRILVPADQWSAHMEMMALLGSLLLHHHDLFVTIFSRPKCLGDRILQSSRLVGKTVLCDLIHNRSDLKSVSCGLSRLEGHKIGYLIGLALIRV